MASTLFKEVNYNAGRLIEEIDTGDIGLPDIQRPFVWSHTKVRNLFDSMYRGFPVGYLLFWSNAGVGVRQIGDGTKQSSPRLLIVDGQQRLTSLYSVLRGKPVLNENYSETRLRIGFRPRDAQFTVTDPAIEKDPDYLPDISVLWAEGQRRQVERDFLARLSKTQELKREEEDRLTEALDRLYDLQHYPFTAMELSASVDEEQVAEVFVRINSQGITLNQDDFILTLMSVFWEEGRKELERFSREARKPTTGTASPFNHFIEPDPGQLLRVAIALGFRRGALRHVYSLLRGRDLKTGQFSEQQREAQFDTLRSAQSFSLDLTNWHEFLKVLIRAGFRSGRMITSQNALLYAYAFFLIGRHDYGVDAYRLREVIARWFFMSALTGRYTSSPESRVEQDLNRLPEEKSADAFVDALDGIVDQTLTRDYWGIALPNALATSSARSPELFAYYAALVLLDARVLFSHLRVSELFDPAVNAKKAALERHHLFPRAYLAKTGRSGPRVYNQIANMALLEWPDNAAVSDTAPADYFPALMERLKPAESENARFWHALPAGWEQLEYEHFIETRRRLMANVIRAGFERLRRETDEPPIDLRTLVAEGEGSALEFKSSARYNVHTKQRDPELEWLIVKTVAGFANANGGTLLVGVDDDGQPLGLDNDLKLLGKKQDIDGYELWLRDLFEAALGKVTAAGVATTFPTLDEVTVCRVDVPAAGQPVFANRPKGEKADEFFLRSGNSTRRLTPQEVIDYLSERAVASPT